MSIELRQRIFAQLDSIVLIDPHTHINALSPASQSLADILGYHYYTELAHSAGMAKDQIEEAGLDPKEKVQRLIAKLGPIDNTIQYSWFIEMCQQLFGFGDERVTLDNWEALYDSAADKMAAPDWTQTVMQKSKLESLFLTNDFDDPLEGFDTATYIPCLRTDDLVFHLAKPTVQQRLGECTGVDVTDSATLRYAIAGLFHYFKSHNARACAISLPPDFSPSYVSDARADTAIAALYRDGMNAHESHRKAAANFIFWTLAQFCGEYQLPFDLMIGVNRAVYQGGVYQGMDLYDSRVSLHQYKELFNAFPQVTFPISVLASVTNQELTSYAWIFPNVVTNGHWWYSNTPTFIEHDLAARLEAVPRTKQIGYYSDSYKLEFALPKFAMYKRILSKVLAERFVIDRGWSEEQAIALGGQVLRGNVDVIFAETPMPVFAPPPEAEETHAPEALAAAAAPMDLEQAVLEDMPMATGEPLYSDVDRPAEEAPLAMGESLPLETPPESDMTYDDDVALALDDEVQLSDDADLVAAMEAPPAEADMLVTEDDLLTLDIDADAPTPEVATSDEEFLAFEDDATVAEPATPGEEKVAQLDDDIFNFEPDDKRKPS